MSKLLGFDVSKLRAICRTCNKEFCPKYWFGIQKYCSRSCSKIDPARAEERRQTMKRIAAIAARRRTERARVLFCPECGCRLKVADPRSQTCGAKVCMAAVRKRRPPMTDEQRMRRAYAPGQKDANQDELVAALEAGGCAVIDMHERGGGFPDLIVHHRNKTHLVEIKNPANWYGKKKGSRNQIRWAEKWPSPVWIITCQQDVEFFLNCQFDKLKRMATPLEALK